MAERFRFTKVAIDKLPTPNKRTYYRDTVEPKLGLSVTPSGAKSYFAVLTVAGKTRRVGLGKHPSLSVPLARIRAAETATEVANGVNPIEARRDKKAAAVTLSKALEVYIASKELKPRTVDDYQQAFKETYPDWLDKPLSRITEGMVLKRYLERGKVSKARTDNAARVLRAVFNFARATYRHADGASMFATNPTTILSDAKVRYRIPRKRTSIANIDLADWWSAVHAIENRTAAEYLVFLLLTGTRRGEAARLQWEDVDLRGGTFHLTDPKNRIPVTLPLPPTVATSLKRRRQESGTVFELVGDPRGSLRAVRRLSGVEFTYHDLRRTYASLANGLDINFYTVKHLLNHVISASDVTAGYDVPDIERLKVASAKIEDKVLRLVGEKTGAVVALRTA